MLTWHSIRGGVKERQSEEIDESNLALGLYGSVGARHYRYWQLQFLLETGLVGPFGQEHGRPML